MGYLSEFAEFFKLFELQKFSKYVDFGFSVIPVKEKLLKD